MSCTILVMGSLAPARADVFDDGIERDVFLKFGLPIVCLAVLLLLFYLIAQRRRGALTAAKLAIACGACVLAVTAASAYAQLVDVKTACVGENEASCPGPHDVYLTCAAPDDAKVAEEVCDGLGYWRARHLRLSARQGDACGYRIIDVSCGAKKPF